MIFRILDCETTGLDDNPGVVEIAWIDVDKDLNVLSSFDSLVNPEKPISEGAEGVHGISSEQVENEPTISEIDFPVGEVCLIVHNLSYDRPLVEPYMNIVAGCDTLVLARRLLPDCENHQLSTLQAYCELPKTIAHRAPGDVQTVLHLLKYLVEGSGMNLIQLVNYSNTPQMLKTMPWGKHSGKKFSDIPSGYMRWLRKLKDLDLDMQLTLSNL